MCRQEQPDNQAQHGEQAVRRERREPVFRGGSEEREVREVHGDGETGSGCAVRELREMRGSKFYRLSPRGADRPCEWGSSGAGRFTLRNRRDNFQLRQRFR